MNERVVKIRLVKIHRVASPLPTPRRKTLVPSPPPLFHVCAQALILDITRHEARGPADNRQDADRLLQQPLLNAFSRYQSNPSSAMAVSSSLQLVYTRLEPQSGRKNGFFLFFFFFEAWILLLLFFMSQ